MIWLSWRQLRTQAAVAAAGVVLAAIVLAITGPHLADLTPNVFDQLTQADRTLYFGGIVVVALAPALLGAFWGAPLVARELEAGTHRLVWSQSVTRRRWLATRLGLTGLAAAAAMGVLSFGVTWWSSPLDGALSDTHGSLPSRLTPVSFAMRGIAPVAYGVFAVALGVALGLVLRRSLPAMAATLAVFAFVQIAMPLWVRPHVVPPVTRIEAISMDNFDGIQLRGEGPNPVTLFTARVVDPGDWVLSNRTLDASGQPVATLPAWFAQCLPPPSADGPATQADGKGGLPACLSRLDAEGYRQQLVYQPASRFWALQWVETGVFLALSALLGWFAFYRLRRV
jgi:ABC-2 family transporter protein